MSITQCIDDVIRWLECHKPAKYLVNLKCCTSSKVVKAKPLQSTVLKTYWLSISSTNYLFQCTRRVNWAFVKTEKWRRQQNLHTVQNFLESFFFFFYADSFYKLQCIGELDRYTDSFHVVTNLSLRKTSFWMFTFSVISLYKCYSMFFNFFLDLYWDSPSLQTSPTKCLLYLPFIHSGNVDYICQLYFFAPSWKYNLKVIIA